MVNNVDSQLRYSSKEFLIYRHNSRLTDMVPFDDDVIKLCPYNCEGTTATVHFNTMHHQLMFLSTSSVLGQISQIDW